MGFEVWKDIIGFIGYQVSNLGNIRTCIVKRNQWKRAIELSSTWRLRKPCKHSNYLALTMYTQETPSKLVLLKVHRLVWEAFVGPIPKGQCIDHINNNGFDNRLENLRLATHSQNHMNQKPRDGRKFKGIERRGNKFIARVTLNGKRKYLGTFLTEQEASLAYDQEAKNLFGDYAKLNA